MPFLAIDGRSVAYRYSGSPGRPAVLLAHPLGMSQAVWDEVREQLASQFYLVSWDLPGHGASSPQGRDLVAQDLTDEAIAIMDALHIPRAHFVGTSIGGVIGQALLLSAPQRLDQVILTNTGPVIGTAEAWQQRAARVRSEGLATMAPELVDRWFSASFKANCPADFNGWQTQLARSDDDSYARLCELLGTTDFRGRLGEVDGTVQLVAGEMDGATPISALESLGHELPATRLEVFDDVAHVPAVECPTRFAAKLADWLTSPNRSSPVTYEEGLRTRKAVLGDEHVKRASSGATTLDAPFQNMITRMAWGELWGNPDLTRRERSMITLAVLAALGRDGELILHLDTAKRIGLSEAQLRQALMHVSIYAGVPAANHAFKLAKERGWGLPL